MKVVSFNANGIRARLPIITQWVEKEVPDVLCIQETKVQDPDFPKSPFEELGYYADDEEDDFEDLDEHTDDPDEDLDDKDEDDDDEDDFKDYDDDRDNWE